MGLLVKISFVAAMGPFRWILIPLATLVAIDIIFLFILKFGRQDMDPERFKTGLSGLLVLGSMTAAIGMLGQILGIWNALSVIIVATDINPELVVEGLKTSFITTVFGLVTFILSALAWGLLVYLPDRKA
jgi:hypothetical protein